MSHKLLAPMVGLTIAATLTACSGGDQQTAPQTTSAKAAFTYPDSKRDESVVEDYHGTKVADPYRWLEDDVRDNPAVAQWVKEQNAVTNSYLQSMPERKQIEKRMTQLWDYAKVGMPTNKRATATLFV